MRRLLRFLLVAVIVLPIAVAAYFAAVETALYLHRSPERAQEAAQRVFLQTCAGLNLDPKSFTGPHLLEPDTKGKRDKYEFVWSETPEKTLAVYVSYFPYDLEATLSTPLAEEHESQRRARLRGANAPKQ